jgi:predicted HAD superfamily Cof-like phosphohydrolase
MEFEKIDSLNQVAEFHRTFKHPILESPSIPSIERCNLRVNLIAEELKELEQAIADGNLVEIADALCDIQYVLSGAVLEFGLGKNFVDLFNEVQRSNMSKACNSLKEAEETVRHYAETKGEACYFKEIDGKYLVYRESDHKTMKSIGYSPASLADLIK